MEPSQDLCNPWGGVLDSTTTATTTTTNPRPAAATTTISSTTATTTTTTNHPGVNLNFRNVTPTFTSIQYD